MSSFLTAFSIPFWSIESACWSEQTSVWIRVGIPPSYSTVTWDLPSGRAQPHFFVSRRRFASSIIRCAR